uniref:Uncharacterized protein n=1 Tax=Anguilla anguilla TaxID=7936 RepID=A0A0E9WWS6_ANGAN
MKLKMPFGNTTCCYEMGCDHVVVKGTVMRCQFNCFEIKWSIYLIIDQFNYLFIYLYIYLILARLVVHMNGAEMQSLHSNGSPSAVMGKVASVCAGKTARSESVALSSLQCVLYTIVALSCDLITFIMMEK